MAPDCEADDERSRRLARNEDVYRDENDRIEQEAVAWHERMFVCECECSQPDCSARLTVRTTDYERVRANSDRFVVARGHDDPEIEDVVESFDGYVVVEKRGEAGEVARETDPR